MHQYFPYLRKHGWDIQAEALLDDRYLTKLFNGERRLGLPGAIADVRRVFYLCRRDVSKFDVIVVQIEALPRFPFILESVLVNGYRNVVLDFDDAFFVQYRGNPLLKNKFSAMIRNARAVITGNESLASYALQFNDNVTVIPTVIDLDRYTPKGNYKRRDGRSVIGWIGSYTTSVYLRSFEPVFTNIARRHKILLRCVGAGPQFTMKGVEIEALNWSEDTEAEVVRNFDIGVMPLSDDEFARGKSGYKLIQYMACAVPALGTALGANLEILQDGTNGFLAASMEEFEAKLETLINDETERERLGRNGRRTAEERYSLQAQQGTFQNVLMSVHESGCVPPLETTNASFAHQDAIKNRFHQ